MTKALSKTQRAVLATSVCKERGISTSALKGCALHVLDAAEHAALMKNPRVNVPGLALPYFDLKGEPNGHIRTKLLGEFTSKDGKTAKYLSHVGGVNHLYFSPMRDWGKINVDISIPILFLEGELKAIKAAQEGYSAIGISGVWNWRKREEDDTSRAIDDFNLINWKTRVVYICYDSDAATNSSVRAAELALAKELFSRGADPRIVRLPNLPNQTKTGFDDFFVGNGKTAKKKFFDLLTDAEQPFTLKTESASSILNKKFKEVAYVVDGLMSTGLITFSGSPKSGKSWAAISLVHAVATGKPLFDTFLIKKSGCVLYLALEDTPRRIQSRLLALGLGATDKLEFAYSSSMGDDGCAMLERWCEQHPDALMIVIDTLQRFRMPTSGRQNAYEVDYAAMSAIKRIADKFGVAILLIHHLKKGKADDPFERVSGSTAITGAADTNILLLRERASGEATWHITGRDIEDLELAMSFESGQWRMIGDAKSHRASKAEQAVIDAIKALGEPASPKQISDFMGRRIGSRQLLRMQEHGILEWLPGGKYRIKEGADKTARNDRY